MSLFVDGMDIFSGLACITALILFVVSLANLINVIFDDQD